MDPGHGQKDPDPCNVIWIKYDLIGTFSSIYGSRFWAMTRVNRSTPVLLLTHFILCWGHIWFLTRVEIGTGVTLAHRSRRNRHQCYLIKSAFLQICSLSSTI